MTTPKKPKPRMPHQRVQASTLPQHCLLCKSHWMDHSPSERNHKFIPDNEALVDILAINLNQLEPGDIVVEILPLMIRVYRGGTK
jgi:hypothetical protein